MTDGLEHLFPALRSANYQVTSPRDVSYNCIAWAADDFGNWWWPSNPAVSYWPPQVPREGTLENFIRAFQMLGYQPCEDGRPEDGFEKVAIYMDSSNTPSHMARQLPSGHWTSKLGDLEDIQHETLDQLEGRDPAYGNAKQFLKRRRQQPLDV